MARKGFQATIGASLGEGEYVVSAAPGGGARQDTAVAATLAAAIATAVADGASPTQGHVTAINSAYTALTVSNAGDIALTYDTSAVTTLNQLRRGVEAIMRQAQASGLA